MDAKEKYTQLCQTEASIPLFSRPWWLDTVCGASKWEVLLVEHNGKVKASMPLYTPVSGVVTMPQYTQTMGPWFANQSNDTKYATQIHQRQEICTQLIEKIKKYKHFYQNFNYEITDWLPFYWSGYQQTTRYTYILNDIKNSDKVWQNLSPNIRRNIKKAKDKYQIEVRQEVTIDNFTNILDQTFVRQGKKNKMDKHVLAQLITSAQKRGQGDLWGAYDTQGTLHAAAFIVWQENCAYYLAGGGNPQIRHSGAHSLVMWEAIRYVSQFTQKFDFEGSMLQGVERFFREFGAQQVPYFAIKKGKFGLLERARIKLQKWL